MISYKEKRKQFSPEAQARISAGAQEIRNEIRILRAIREASGLSQEELADRLEVGQSYISRLERRDNITLATLAGIAQALGGSIEITINLPEREPVKFSAIEDLF
ncbi:transcriptional regulator [Nostoc sp. 3335mG]|nr:transcriptional regulator [Nostoc sp. 3335mG]